MLVKPEATMVRVAQSFKYHCTRGTTEPAITPEVITQKVANNRCPGTTLIICFTRFCKCRPVQRS